MDNPANYAAGGPLADLSLTTNDSGDDALDSDASSSDPFGTGLFPTITVTTPEIVAGEVAEDLTLDFGFILLDFSLNSQVIDRFSAVISALTRQLGLELLDAECGATARFVSKQVGKAEAAYTKIWTAGWQLRGEANESCEQIAINQESVEIIKKNIKKMKKVRRKLMKYSCTAQAETLSDKIQRRFKKINRKVKKINTAGAC